MQVDPGQAAQMRNSTSECATKVRPSEAYEKGWGVELNAWEGLAMQAGG